MIRIIILASLLVFWCLGKSALAYEAKPVKELLNQNVEYDPEIPTPDEVTGYKLGEILYPPHMHANYVETLGEISERMVVSIIGRSHFGRPIHQVTVSSPENLARLDEIKRTQKSLTEPNAAKPPADHPVIMQFTFGVHGSEPSSYDAAPAMLYFLAAAQGPEIDALLDDAVINIVVPVNPDGANRMAQWTNMHHAVAAVADPQSREHFYEWPWGRTNHYYFDLNRQKLLVTQPESRAVVAFTHRWLPNIAADYHEMGSNSTYMFSPGPPDRRNPLFSDNALKLNQDMNSFITEQLDGEGALYVTEELFAHFYLGFGSSYPNLMGAVPYLFEQSSTRGLIRETEYGTLRYDDKIGQQARVGLAVLRAGLARKAELHSHLAGFYDESRELASDDPVKAYVFSSTDKGRLAGFIDMLGVHSIGVRELARSVKADGRTYEPGEAFLVVADQTHYRIIKGLFGKDIIEEKEIFYDVSGWTQPLAWDIDYAELRGRSFSSKMSGDVLTEFDATALVPDKSPYVYVLEWDSYFAPRALYRLLDAGLRARVIPDETTITTTRGDVQAGRGAIMVPIAGQELTPDKIHSLMKQAASEDSVTVHAATTGFTRQGSDLGGFKLRDVEKPKVLLATGRAVSSNDSGEYWHLLDHEMNIPVSMIDISEMPNMSINKYTHIILPSGQYRQLDEAFRNRLDAWIKSGGVLIASESASRWIVENELASAKFVGDDKDSDNAQKDEKSNDEKGSDKETELPTSYADIDIWDAKVRITGALFETKVDVTHPLVFGLRDSMLAVTKIGTDAFEPTDNPFALPVRYDEDDPILAGFTSEENREMLEGAGMMFAERRGAGSVILFTDNPVFRAYMKGTARLVTNAVFFGNDFRNPRRLVD